MKFIQRNSLYLAQHYSIYNGTHVMQNIKTQTTVSIFSPGIRYKLFLLKTIISHALKLEHIQNNYISTIY